MVKLTKAQIAILERMANGDEAWTISGSNARAFWHNSMADRSPGFNSLHALQKRGLIVNKSTNQFGGAEYVITDAGRLALLDSKENQNG